MTETTSRQAVDKRGGFVASIVRRIRGVWRAVLYEEPSARGYSEWLWLFAKLFVAGLGLTLGGVGLYTAVTPASGVIGATLASFYEVLGAVATMIIAAALIAMLKGVLKLESFQVLAETLDRLEQRGEA